MSKRTENRTGERKMGDIEATPKEAKTMKPTYNSYDYEDLLVDEMEGD